MSAKIPAEIIESELTALLTENGLLRIKDPGKVGELRAIPGYPDHLLMLTTDRLSIFDFVLNCLVEKKGEVITAMTVLVFRTVLKNYDTHLVAYGSGIDRYLPKKLRNNLELQKRALIVRKLEMAPIECIARRHITGSAWEEYLENDGMVYGYALPSGLHDGSELSFTMFTPTTKAVDGHDEPLSRQTVRKDFGDKFERKTLSINIALYAYFEKRGIILPDAKLEFSINVILADKFGPDECRLWDKNEWMEAAVLKKAPPGYDKQPVRELGKKIVTSFKNGKNEQIVGINKLDPKNEEHVAFVHSILIPLKVTQETALRYREIFRRLNDGQTLEEFQKKVMGIAV